MIPAINSHTKWRAFARILPRPPKGPGKSKLDKFRPEIEALLSKGSTQKFIANSYGTTEANLSNWIKKEGSKKQAIENAFKKLSFLFQNNILNTICYRNILMDFEINFTSGGYV